MAHIKIARGYELKYWNAHKLDDLKDRSYRMVEIFDLPEVGVVADIGSGPRCGVFQIYKADTMYAVDPLWELYKKQDLCVIPPMVKIIEGEAETFDLPQLCDLIISVNALDHSGSLKKSIFNIMDNIKDEGLFCMHVHMRSKKQLNKGHQMLITEEEIDTILKQWEILEKVIYLQCPIELKPYKSYVATVRKI